MKMKEKGARMKTKLFATVGIILLYSIVCVGKDNTIIEQKMKAKWITTAKMKSWQNKPDIKLFKGKINDADIVVDLNSKKQEIDGFGGAFNEKGWEALALLTPKEREDVLKSLFDPVSGAKFNICRVPIGASDYATSRYTLNESKDDFEMKNFSIERDKIALIPYIKAAMKYRPDLQLWGSAWTPPSWMKTNNHFDSGNMKDDPKVYAAYALYLANFINAYKGEGIDIFAVAVQNEPLIDRHYPSCLWRPFQFLEFIRDYMGPTFEKMGLEGHIMLGTINDGYYNWYPKKILGDSKANGYILYVGYQWGGLFSVADTRKNYPEKRIIQTETECGNWNDKPEFDPDRPQNDWNYGVYTWNKVKDYFDQGVNSYELWNMVLDEEGKSIDSKVPWPQNAAVVVNKKIKKVIYTPMFYAFKHYSFFVKPGAHYIKISQVSDNAIVFMNPNGELVVCMKNMSEETRTFSICFGEYWFKVALPAMSLNTIVVPEL
jgi:glucosylceramidase